jgi:ribosomal protein S12 methylthiotransferase accessory factor
MSMNITFPGGYAVNAHYKGFKIPTDQPEDNGGANSAPAPFDLFLVSLGTCAAFYALRFCQQRGLPTEGLEFKMDTVDHPETHRTEKIIMSIKVPAEFPEKYRRAIVRATNQCSVKRAILDPPEITVEAI